MKWLIIAAIVACVVLYCVLKSGSDADDKLGED